jgi:hypothetical protein
MAKKTAKADKTAKATPKPAAEVAPHVHDLPGVFGEVVNAHAKPSDT